jgi:hypothetical protein
MDFDSQKNKVGLHRNLVMQDDAQKYHIDHYSLPSMASKSLVLNKASTRLFIKGMLAMWLRLQKRQGVTSSYQSFFRHCFQLLCFTFSRQPY